jgi:hypothetical protein
MPVLHEELRPGKSARRGYAVRAFGIVKVLGSGRAGTASPGLPWEPKAAFHALADYGRTRAEGAGNRPAAAV